MRYQFKADVNAFIAEMRPHYSPSTIKNKERKMSYIAGIFTDLYKDKIYNFWVIPGLLVGIITAALGGLESLLAAM